MAPEVQSQGGMDIWGQQTQLVTTLSTHGKPSDIMDEPRSFARTGHDQKAQHHKLGFQYQVLSSTLR
ncbi:MAG: hypothetical protein CMG33_05480 [Candidatus Marinimicrobia bacterium]|nr:hypothetical protein [Candidatus Neomarinimicrobiota bacterium]